MITEIKDKFNRRLDSKKEVIKATTLNREIVTLAVNLV